ncbi:hypothetical protein HN51_057981 [Arachis hypogaea]
MRILCHDNWSSTIDRGEDDSDESMALTLNSCLHPEERSSNQQRRGKKQHVQNVALLFGNRVGCGLGFGFWVGLTLVTAEDPKKQLRTY